MTSRTNMSFLLSGEQERELREALVEAFAPTDLAIIVHDHVKDELHNLAAPGPYRQQVFGLIQACRQRGWLGRLVFGAVTERSENPRVLALARQLGLHPAGEPGDFEKLVGSNATMVELHPWLHRCSIAAARVCQVRVRGRKEGSGFLVGPNTVLTNHHVVATALERPDELSFVFDYARSISGEVHSGTSFVGRHIIDAASPGPSSQFDERPTVPLGENELDFALIELTASAGQSGVGGAAQSRMRGWFVISPAAYDFNTVRGLAILQHPLGDPVKLAIDFGDYGRLVGCDARRVRYQVPTLAGSSGSPVLEAESLQLVALHQGGLDMFNQGIPVSTIAARSSVSAYLAGVPPL